MHLFRLLFPLTSRNVSHEFRTIFVLHIWIYFLGFPRKSETVFRRISLMLKGDWKIQTCCRLWPENLPRIQDPAYYRSLLEKSLVFSFSLKVVLIADHRFRFGDDGLAALQEQNEGILLRSYQGFVRDSLWVCNEAVVSSNSCSLSSSPRCPIYRLFLTSSLMHLALHWCSNPFA